MDLLTVYNVLEYSRESFYHLGSVMQLFVVIYLLNGQFRKHPVLSSFHYSLSCYGFIIDLISFVLYKASYTSSKFLKNANDIFHIFSRGFSGPLHTALIFNQFIAIVFWRHYGTFSNKTCFYLVLLMICVYPFVMAAFILPKIACLTDLRSSECNPSFNWLRTCRVVSNTIHSALCLILSMIIVRKAKKCHKDAERRIILQCLFFSILFNLHNILHIAYIYIPASSPLRGISGSLSDTMFHVSHYTQVVLLIVMTPKIRQDFVQFYDIRQLWKKSSERKIQSNF